MSGDDIFSGWRDALQAGELRFPRCEACGSWNWYPLSRCRSCGSPRQSWTTVPPRGALYSWTRVHRSFGKNSAIEPPYVTGVVDVAAASGVRLICLQRPHSLLPAIGSEVMLTLERTSNGSRWLFDAVAAS